MYDGSFQALLGRRVLVKPKPGVIREGIARRVETGGDEYLLVVDLDGRDGIGRTFDADHVIGPKNPLPRRMR